MAHRVRRTKKKEPSDSLKNHLAHTNEEQTYGLYCGLLGECLQIIIRFFRHEVAKIVSETAGH